MSLPIRARLTIWYSAALILIVLAVGGFLFFRLRIDLVRGLDATLASRAQELSLQLQSGNFQDVGDAQPLPGFPAESGLAQILSRHGSVIQASGGPQAEAPLLTTAEIKRAFARSLRATVGVGSAHEPIRVLAVALDNSADVLVVAQSMEDVENTVTHLLVLIAIAIPIAAALSAIGGFLLARRALLPVDRMTQAAAAIGAADLDARLEVPAIKDEVGRLGRTLNQMLTRLQGAIQTQRQFTADASHELRTPLSIMRAELDVALRSASTAASERPVLESAREEVSRMSRLVEDLMTLARLDEGALEMSRARIDLTELATKVIARFRTPLSLKEITASVEGDPVYVWGDAERLDRLLSNLVDNAAKYSPEGGRIQVSVNAEGQTARVVVADSGPGIPPDSLVHIFSRFYRVDKARSRAQGGTGLGLAISQSIAEAHDGDITVESESGGGARFTVHLPIAVP